MTKKAKGRGYLSQLAEPQRAGQPMLTVRPGARRRADPGNDPGKDSVLALIPAIEDHFEFAPTPEARLPVRGLEMSWDSPRGRFPAASRETVFWPPVPGDSESVSGPVPGGEFQAVPASRQPVAKETGWASRLSYPAEDNRLSNRPEAGLAESRKEQPVSSAGARQRRQEGADRHGLPEIAVIETRVRDGDSDAKRGRGKSPEETKKTAQILTEAARNPARVDLPRSDEMREVETEGSRASGNSKPARRRREASYEPQPAAVAEANVAAVATASERQVPPILPRTTRGEDKTASGPRVHIGTVEIRAVLPQSQARPAAAPAPQQNEHRTNQSRTGLGAGEPLARSLAWSFGLVQG